MYMKLMYAPFNAETSEGHLFWLQKIDITKVLKGARGDSRSDDRDVCVHAACLPTGHLQTLESSLYLPPQYTLN
jgi:hypothetical protein